MVLILHQSRSMDFLTIDWINHSNEKLDLKPQNSGVGKPLKKTGLNISIELTSSLMWYLTDLKEKFKQRLTIE